MQNNSSRNPRQNYNARGNAVTVVSSTTSAFSSDLQAAMSAETKEYMEKLAAFNAYAEATKVCDAVVPYTTIRFGDLLKEGVHDSGRKMVTINPNGTIGTAGSQNTNGAINAMIDAFATGRYNGGLMFGQHVRLFNPANPVEKNVMSRLNPDTGLYQRFDWITRQWRVSTPWGNELAKWLGKHHEIDAMLQAVNNGYRYNVVFFEDYQYERFSRNVMGRMNLTIAQAILDKANDWAVADASRQIRRDGQKDPEIVGSLVVDGLDLSKIGVDVFVLITTPMSKNPVKFPVRVGNQNDLNAVAKAMANTANKVSLLK